MASIAALESHLRNTIEGEVRFDAGTRAAYATDASNYRQVPVGVVIPRHEGDVIAALSLARENSMPILARGGGTSLAGQACNAAIVLDFSKYMNRVLAIDAERAHSSGRARRRPEPSQQCARAARPVLRSRPVDQRSMHHRRHDRQQFMRRALGGVRQDGR